LSEQGLNDRRVLLGVTGGIAAYKAAELVRRLREAGAQVRVVMTEGATRFVTPLTFQALSDHPVRSTLWDDDQEAAMGHIELARWAEQVLVAPASADFLARLAGGHGDDLLTTVCLASAAPVSVAPAMNQQMWANAATQANIATLSARGIRVLGPGSGSQACGDVGLGRMLEPEQLLRALADADVPPVFAGLSVLVSAGPTYEDIDPVRYVGNRSSGRMGYAIADAARAAGARVTLVSGPTSLAEPAGLRRRMVRSAHEMHLAIREEAPAHDVFISAAAVADYRPATVSPSKIKKGAARHVLELEATVDILAELGAQPSHPFLVGFAAETDHVLEAARGKLERKRLDLILANRVGVAGTGFDAAENELTALWPGGERVLPRCHKRSLAQAVVELVAERLAADRPAASKAP